MKKKNGWKAFCWLLWLVACFVFVYFKRYISSIDAMYSYGFLAGTFCLFILQLKNIFGED